MHPTDRKWLRSPRERVGTLSYAALPPPAAANDLDSQEYGEQELLRALRNGDEAAFEWLLDRYYAPMLRLARTFVGSREEAEEVVQDAWLGVLAGLGRFEGRSSLRTWIFRILVNRARSRARREARQTPFSSFQRAGDAAGSDREIPVADWLLGTESARHNRWGGEGWVPPRPDEEVLSEELREHIEAAIRGLPERQQAVITLRDVEGWSPREVCELLNVSEGNQRVLLHRARLKVRNALDLYFDPPETGSTPSMALA